MSNLTRRIDLNLGYTCNINCRFCYYQNSMHDGTSAGRKDLSTQDAKRWLLFFRRKGLDAVDLTGGEPTIRRDIVELIAYARAANSCSGYCSLSLKNTPELFCNSRS